MSIDRACSLLLLANVAAACGQGPSTSAPAVPPAVKATTPSSGPSGFVTLRESREDHTGWVTLPGQLLMHPSCVHIVPAGGRVEKSGDVTLDGKVVLPFSTCAHEMVRDNGDILRDEAGHVLSLGDGHVPEMLLRSYSGVLEGATAALSQNVDNYGTSGLTVPAPPPAIGGQTIFLYSEMSGPNSVTTSGIAWGSFTANGVAHGGSYWTAMAWFTTASGGAYGSIGGNMPIGESMASSFEYAPGDTVAQSEWIVWIYNTGPHTPSTYGAMVDTVAGAEYPMNTVYSGVVQLANFAINPPNCNAFPAGGGEQISISDVSYETDRAGFIPVTMTPFVNNTFFTSCGASATFTQAGGTTLNY